MEGLEISEVNYSRIELENRYDSEYFKQIFLKAESYLNSREHFNLGGKYKVTDGEHGSVVIQDSGIKYLTAENIKKGYVDISKVRFVDEEVDKRNARARVNIGDILISIKGTLGEIAVAEDWLLPANMNRDVAIIKPLTKEFPSEYVALFMMSEYGALQSLRGGSGGVQQMITLERLRKFIIPFFSNDFSEIVKALYNSAKNYRIQSQNKYTQAENLLLETLGLKDFELSKESVNIKTFNESFGTSGRLDAEYYQKKYEDLEQSLLNSKHGAKTLNSCIEYVRTGEYSSSYLPKLPESVFYLRNTNFRKCLITPDENYAVNPENFNTSANEGDIITSRVGTMGLFGVIPKDLKGAVYSDNVLCFKLKDVYIPLVYSLLFSSGLYQPLIEKIAGGSVQPLITQTTLKGLIVPIIEKDKQKEIANLVEESFKSKKQSEQLLELAKTAVEKAIEENEEKASNYINEKLTELKITIDHA